MNFEELVEFGDVEHFVDLWVDVAEAELAAFLFDFVVNGDEGTERGRGEVVDGGEGDDESWWVFPVDDGGELLADLGDVRFVENFSACELDLDSVVELGNFQT